MRRREDTTEDLRLLVAPVHSALVIPDKLLAPLACGSIRRILEAGIASTIISGRHPGGMKILIDDLQLQCPITASNGGPFVQAVSPLFAKTHSLARLCELWSTTLQIASSTFGFTTIRTGLSHRATVSISTEKRGQSSILRSGCRTNE